MVSHLRVASFCEGSISQEEIACRVDLRVETHDFGKEEMPVETSKPLRLLLLLACVAQPPALALRIRAPQLTDPGPGVEVLARVDGRPVLMRERNVMAATFHPELTSDPRVHELLLGMG